MKKIVWKAVALLLLMTLCLGAIVSCKPVDLAGEGTAYGIVGDYVGFISVRTDTKGKITNVVIDEMQLPDAWAVQSKFDEADDGDFSASGYAKKIMIGGEIFEGSENGGKVDYRLSTFNNGISLVEFLRSSVNAKWYVEQMHLGNYGVVKAGGGVNNKFTDDNGLGLGYLFQKSKNGYWPAGTVGLGWKANVEAIEQYIKANGFPEKGMSLRGADKIWTVNGTATGATINAFNEYLSLAQIAYSIATSKTAE